jgi:hypothetical protein
MPSATSLFKASWGRVWRQIAISGQDELDRLDQVIIEAFEFLTKQKRRSDLGRRINMAFVFLSRRPGPAVLR